ncbi:MAG: LysR family transcriptional regulator [Aliidongia sp.]
MICWSDLIAVAETRSFTKAAAQLHRSQSTISLQIRRLEEDRRHAPADPHHAQPGVHAGRREVPDLRQAHRPAP